MDGSERYARLAELFAATRDLPPGDREDYLRTACGGDPELLQETLELLAEDASGTGDAMDVALGEEAEFERAVQGAQLKAIGKYRILGICGSGGMGTVYEAEQDAPSRRVALKVIRAEATRPELLLRFRRETEILARLQHTGIAQIFEAGEFEQDGATRPFFAMEFVDGRPLTTFAERMELGVGARIDLFLQVCDAIHYAHGQGVVHRDLKPDNIFVQETSDPGGGLVAGQPKILDFGVARVADADGQATLATGAGALLGSVVYMSPEQAAGDGDAVGPWSDLYSLGVVLFELLSGELPYHVRRRSLVDALHAIRHDEPTRLGSVAPDLRGDLETIVGKCLEKNVARRYPSVAAFADDLRRFQAVKPIAARPPTTWYQLQRFTQRNRALVGGVLTTVLALVIGAAFAVVFALESRENARSAQASQESSEREAYRANMSAASALLDSDPAHARRILSGVDESRRGWEHSYLSAALTGLALEFGQVAPRSRGRHNNRAHGDMYLMAGGDEVLARRAPDEFGVWHVRTGEQLRTFRVPGEVDLYSVAADGSRMAVALTTGEVIVGDPGAPGTWETWDEGTDPVDALAVAPGGRGIAVDRPGSLRFGRPGAWQQHESSDTRTYFFPSLMEFNHDGSRLAWVDGLLHVFDCASGQLVAEPIQSDQGHWSLAFAPDGERVAAGQLRREIRVFDPGTGTYDTELLGHNESVLGVAYGGPSRLASFSSDGTLRIWDLDDARQIAIFDAPGTAKALFIDDDHVLSLTNGRFHLWQLNHRRCRELRGHRGHVFVPVFSSDGGLLATSAPWADLLIWDPLETAPLRSMPAQRRVQFAFGPSDDELLSSLARWGPHTGRLRWAIGEPSDETFGVSGVSHALLGGSETLVDGGRGPAAKGGGMAVHRNEHWVGQDSGSEARPSRAQRDGVPTVLGPAEEGHRVLGQHPLLALGGMGSYEFHGAIAEWVCFGGALDPEHAAALDDYLDARKKGATVALPEFDSAPPLLAHFRADRDSLELDGNGHVQGWRALNDPALELGGRGRPAQSIGFVEAEPGGAPAAVRFKGGYGTHRWLEAALPGAAEAECLTVCWLGEFGGGAGLQTAYTIGEIHLPFGEFGPGEIGGKVGQYLSFSRDGRVLADSWSAEQGGAVTVRDRGTGHAIAQLEGVFHGVDFHPDATSLACADGDGRVHIFDPATGALLSSFDAHNGTCFDVAFSPDGERLATCGNDNALRLWDARTFEPLLEFPGHRSYVRGVAWSPDSTMLVSACADYVVRVWDAVPRRERFRQRLAAKALEDAVAGEVEALAADHEDPQELRMAMGRRWADEPERRRAALKALARRAQRAEDAAKSAEDR